MQKLELQVLWLDNSLGLAVNQKKETENFPITPYYFWPVSEAWEQIRFDLESKQWITDEERIKFLNLVVKVMNKWQKARANSTNEIFNNTQFQDSFNIIGLP